MKGFLYGQTEYNILKSSVRLLSYVKEAKRCGFDFLSITDSNMHASYKFYTLCEEYGIKPIIGLEYEVKEEDNSYSKVLLYAKNNDGYKNLLKITTNVKTNDIDSIENVKEFKDNLYYIFVFNDSFIERLFIKKEYSILDEYLDTIKELNGYIGISYINKPSHTKVIKAFVEYIKTKEVKTIMVHHLKYLKSEDSIIYEALTAINGNKDTIDEFDDFSFLENPICDDVIADFVNGINLNLFKDKIALPKYPNKKGIGSYEYLSALCHKGLEKRGLYVNNYISRLEYELQVIHKMGYDDYFLIVWDFILYAKQNKILVGPGRGSAAGSLVAYCLGITEIDPLKYDLLFERFLNPERVSMPDIDTDFPDIDRDIVINHVKDFYGKMHVCNITAFGTFQVKSSARELAKVFNIEKDRVDKIIDMIESLGYDKLLEEYKNNELYEFLYVARGLEGLPKHISTHAAGIILSGEPLDDIIPLSLGINDLYQSQFEASDLEKIGLLKMDFLGISNLTMIDGMIRDIKGFSIEKLRNIPLDDERTYKLLQNADTLGVFQMEKQGFRNALRELKPTSFNDVVAILALYRPGPMDNIPDYIERKHGKRFAYLHKDLEPILKDTYGVIVYQEQIMKIAQSFAGYSLGEADLLRRAVSKKDASKLEVMSSDFIARAIKKGYSKDIAEAIYNLIYKFANYGFNKSHSVAYALFAYEMAYLKANHFNAFMSNIMNNVITNTNTLISYIAYAKSHNLLTQKPNINVSTDKFVFVKNWLFMPLNSIFSLGNTVALQIVNEREKNGLFRNFDDFITRCKFLSQSVIEALIYSGALDIFGKSKKSMIENSTGQSAFFMQFIDDKNKKENDDTEFDISILREKEKKYLGLNIEYNLFKNMNEYYNKYRAISLSMIKEKEFSNVIVAFSSLKEIKTKKGDLMLVLEIEDDKKSLHAIIFPKVYKEIPKGVLQTGVLYNVSGVLERDNRNELSYTITRIELVN